MKKYYNHTYRSKTIPGLVIRVDDIGIKGKCKVVCVEAGECEEWEKLKEQIQDFEPGITELADEYWRDISFNLYLNQAELCIEKE